MISVYVCGIRRETKRNKHERECGKDGESVCRKTRSFQKEIATSRRGALKEKRKDGGLHRGRKILKLAAKFCSCAETKNARCWGWCRVKKYKPVLAGGGN